MARHLVFICGADAARGGADFRRAARRFGGLFHLTMIGKNQVRAVRKMQTPGNVDSVFRERIEFADERGGVHHNARADHGVFAGAQNSARDQLQHEAFTVEDHRMAGVVATRASRNVIERSRKIIHDFAFAFVAPLRAYDYDRLHQSFTPL